jgi:hypothetical protein
LQRELERKRNEIYQLRAIFKDEPFDSEPDDQPQLFQKNIICDYDDDNQSSPGSSQRDFHHPLSVKVFRFIHYILKI